MTEQNKESTQQQQQKWQDKLNEKKKECEEYRAKQEGLESQLMDKVIEELQEQMDKVIGIYEHEDIMKREIEKIETDFKSQIEILEKTIEELHSSKQQETLESEQLFQLLTNEALKKIQEATDQAAAQEITDAKAIKKI